jgi:hypothetical protein
MIASAPDVFTWVKLGATLAHNDIAWNYFLAAKLLNTKPFGFRIATISSTTTRFLMCHFLLSILLALLPVLYACCDQRWVLGRTNASNLYFREPLPVALTLQIIFAPLKFNNAYFLCTINT